MRILVTGFEPNDDGLNASKELVRSLAEIPPISTKIFHERVHFQMMSGKSGTTNEELLDSINRVDPDFCVCIGQAPGRNKITLERFATNLKDFGSPDASGNIIRGEVIEADGPAAYRNTLPDLEGIIEALNKAGILAAASNHAGNHLCNQIMYHALHCSGLICTDTSIGGKSTL